MGDGEIHFFFVNQNATGADTERKSVNPYAGQSTYSTAPVYIRIRPAGKQGGYAGGVSADPVAITIDNHYYDDVSPVLDVQKMLNCFASISDQNVVCYVGFQRFR
jgi:hypothetical protein